MRRFFIILYVLVSFAAVGFSETVDIAVTINAGMNLDFSSISITNKDFTSLSDGSQQWVGTFPWFYANNMSGGSCKLQGRITQSLGANWTLQGRLDPPMSVGGVFGLSAQGGNLITFTTASQDFVTGISSGKAGDMQMQTLLLTGSFAGFVEKASQPFNITIQWTVVAE